MREMSSDGRVVGYMVECEIDKKERELNYSAEDDGCDDGKG